jgi:DNA repair protein RecN (Recombination protein N)
MLQTLRIHNFALIEELHLDFKNGFTVFTGETGSGKSIILGALNLILGERADYSVIRDENKKTVVEADFNIKAYDLATFFEENDLDYHDETCIRREVLSQGKSRAFINDTPVQLTVLKELAEKLIHIHSQHHTLSLKEQSFQFDFLDYIADAISVRISYRTLFTTYKSKLKHLTSLKENLLQLKKEEDYNTFQLNEINELDLTKTDYQSLEDELNSLEHFSTIKETLSFVDFKISSERELLDKTYEIKALLDKNKHLHSALEAISGQIKNVVTELKEIQYEVEKQLDNLQDNPEKRTNLEQQLSKYNQILLKHHFKNQEELTNYYQELQTKQHNTEHLAAEIEVLESSLAQQLTQLEKLDTELQEIRKSKKSSIEAQVTNLLAELKMPATSFQFALEDTQQLTEIGSHKLSILFSPNKGLEAKAIEKVASGGELSRLMLSMQLLLSEKKMLPTIIFDEIDTGVSGDVAQKMGELLQKMGAKMQVMAITHLPQVAAKGQQQYKVTKSSSDNKTNTSVLALNHTEHIQEVARLMSGENITEAAIENAKFLIEN